MSLERRRRVSSGWFDTEDVPALRLEALDVPPGEKVTIRASTGEAFRGLELEIAAGRNEFNVHALTIDGEPQLITVAEGFPVEGMPAYVLHDSILEFRFTADDGEMVMVVQNLSTEKKTFRAFVLGRVRMQEEVAFT